MRTPVCLLAVALPLIVSLGTAKAMDVPDSAQRARLQESIGHLGSVQILGAGRATLLLKPVVRDDGLHMREPYRAPRLALVEIGDVPKPPPPPDFVPWSAIEAVQVKRSMNPGSMARGFVIGGLLGALVSMPFVQALGRADVPRAPAISFFAVPGAAVGVVFGAGIQHWETVYPAPASGSP